MQHGNFVQMDNWHEVQTGSMECFDVKGEIRETFLHGDLICTSTLPEYNI